MPVHSYVVLAGFTLFLVLFLLRVIGMGPGSSLLGTPTIEKRYYYSGKITLFTTWVLFIGKAISPGIGYISQPLHVSWIAVVILYIGIILATAGFTALGGSLRVGLPQEETTLRTGGIYRFSRNPLYLGVYLISFASCLYFLDLVNVVFMFYGIFMHHRIVLGEERFLSERFGKDWEIYSARVRRYI